MRTPSHYGPHIAFLLIAAIAVASGWTQLASAKAAPPTENAFTALPVSSLSHYRQKFPLGPQGRFMTVYANKSLTRYNDRIRAIVIVIHGAGRDADEYFRSAMAGAYLSGAFGDTLIVAPRFAASDGSSNCADALEPDEIRWGCESWKIGGGSPDVPETNTFKAIDTLLKAVVRADTFPNIARVVVTGHSAGGQFVSRYALFGSADESLHVKPLYIPVNASSYLYLDRQRPMLPRDATRPHTVLTPRDGLGSQARFDTVLDPQGCQSFNSWPYGLENRPVDLAGVAVDILERNFSTRRIMFAAGQIDTLALAGLDDSCGANMQGRNRLDRAISYWSHGNDRYGTAHQLVIVPLCGHNARCVFTSPVLMPALFEEDRHY